MSGLVVSRHFPASALRISHQGVDLTLRPLAVSDAPSIVAAIGESLEDLQTFMPWSHVPQTLEMQVERIRTNVTAGLEGSAFDFGLFAPDGRFLAACGLERRIPSNPDALEIGYWTRSHEAGRGLATLMTRLLIVYAFEGLGIDRLQISHNVANEASARVIAKCGFPFEGNVRHLYARPSNAVIAAGLHPSRTNALYALVAGDVPGLPWYLALRNELRVSDLFGVDRCYLWRRPCPS